MNIKRTIGPIAIELEQLGVSLEVGGFELEMTDLTVGEYIDILKHQKEIAQEQSNAIQSIMSAIQAGLQPAKSNKPSLEDILNAKMNKGSVEDFIKNLSSIPGVKVTKVDGDNPFFKGFSPDNPFFKK